MAAWRNLGTLMIIFLAGLQTIPDEVKEAAQVDGATGMAGLPPDHAADAEARRCSSAR